MELRAGYKKSEIGIIPYEWDVLKLGDLFKFKNGLNKAKEFFGYATSIVNYMDVYANSGLLSQEIKGCVNVSKAEIKAFEVRKGDVFFTRTSETVEEVGISSVMLDEPSNTVFSGFILRARPQDNTIDDKYKKYCFSTYYVRNQITSTSTYTTRALTNGRVLSAISIARPHSRNNTPSPQRFRMSMPCSLSSINSSPRSATSNRPQCSNSSPDRLVCQALAGSGR